MCVCVCVSVRLPIFVDSARNEVQVRMKFVAVSQDDEVRLLLQSILFLKSCVTSNNTLLWLLLSVCVKQILIVRANHQLCNVPSKTLDSV